MAASSYKSGLRLFRAKIQTRGQAVIQSIGGQIAEELVIRTPEDTSRAEANWEAALNTVPQIFDTDKRDLGGQASIERAKQIAALMKAGDVFVMANSTPYIIYLEHGWSKQAPAGMRDVTAALFRKMVERAVNEANG